MSKIKKGQKLWSTTLNKWVSVIITKDKHQLAYVKEHENALHYNTLFKDEMALISKDMVEDMAKELDIQFKYNPDNNSHILPEYSSSNMDWGEGVLINKINITENYTEVPLNVLYADDLSLTEKGIYTVLLYLEGVGKPTTLNSVTNHGADSKSEVSLALKSLVRLKYIKKDKKGNYNTIK